MNERGDLIRNLYAKGDEADRIKFNRADVNAMPNMMSAFDMMEALAQPKNASIRDATANIWMHFDCAAEHLRHRARFLGLPEAGEQGFVERARSYVEDGLRQCESPIEKLLLPWLIMEDYGPKISTFPVPVYLGSRDKLAPKGDIVIVPQLAFIRVRLDFAIIARLPGGMRIVAVECDGKEFHQRDRDVKRDGFLASFGIPTIRASGSEIHTRPRDVSVRASAALQEMME